MKEIRGSGVSKARTNQGRDDGGKGKGTPSPSQTAKSKQIGASVVKSSAVSFFSIPILISTVDV